MRLIFEFELIIVEYLFNTSYWYTEKFDVLSLPLIPQYELLS